MIATALFTLFFCAIVVVALAGGFHYGVRYVMETFREKRNQALTDSFQSNVEVALSRIEEKARKEVEVATSEHPAGPPPPPPSKMKRRLPDILGLTK